MKIVLAGKKMEWSVANGEGQEGEWWAIVKIYLNMETINRDKIID